MSAVSLREVVKDFVEHAGNVRAVDRVSFEVEEGELLVLLGPSGCGKTTTLRMIAGLEEPDQGEVWLGGRQVSNAQRNLFVPTEKRNIGMVFQSYAIWPHMTVFENVAYPLRVRRVSRGLVREKVGKTLELVGLQGLEDRPATQLSGGQQQRVALARAVVFEPRLLLLDEPLSNLDAKLRIHMRIELKQLQRQMGITSVFVTHDQAESMALADRIVVMNRGRIEQIGTPIEIYERPVSRFVSEFVGSINVLAFAVTSIADGAGSPVLTLAHGAQRVRCVAGPGARPGPGQQIRVSIRPEKLVLHPADVSSASLDGLNVWHGRVSAAAYYGDHREYDVEAEGDQMLRVVTPPGVVVDRGERVAVACDPSDVVVMVA